ncbi:MAG: hypothetical protein M1818_000350 [Claussenomyces sp. TS43310]|nr:MAG: hypothetical protein M1818_000350 [Claussenomyces sp. TS43310]
MSILFYKPPDYLSKSIVPISTSQCDRYIERASGSARAIPPGLSFEAIIENKTLPPCSLSDFMDYLFYIEHSIENLQFYLWHRDYQRRWNMLSEKERSLSPQGQTTLPIPPAKKSQGHAAQKPSVATTLFPLETEDAKTSPNEVSFDFPNPRNPDVSNQPFREECDFIVRKYILNDSPRQMNLSQRDRDIVLGGLQDTTHPSVFNPILRVAEATLRGQSHLNFVRWSICNGNKPRTIGVRTNAMFWTVVGLVAEIILILSRAARWWRILVALLWLLSVTAVIVSFNGLCLLLYVGRAHEIRPWEVDDATSERGRRFSADSTVGAPTIRLASKMAVYPASSQSELGDGERSIKGGLTYINSIGYKESWEDSTWEESYKRKPLARKVVDKSVWIQEESLRKLQDKIVLKAFIWCLIIIVPVTAGLTAIPKGNFF